ncbi:MAG: SMP-30/gluconolactonase/LRE family protein [Ilumatobacteraceae bacterium]
MIIAFGRWGQWGLQMSIVKADSPGFESLVSPDATLTQIGSGYVFSEGPVWSVSEQALYFSDIPGDKRFRWTEADGTQLVMAPTFKANGMAIDIEDRLIVCEHNSSSITRFHKDGWHETVCFHHGGVYLNSPNDLVASMHDGSIYFTDPDYGRWNDWIGLERTPLLGFKAVFRVPHEGGEAQLVTGKDEFDQPNGLCFSPDESLMYVNDSPRAHVKVFDVADDGMLVNGRVFFDQMGGGTIAEGSPDGMECDEFGNVWVTGPGGVWVISPEGERLGRIETPEVCGSLCWGGRDLKTLFLTTSTTVHSMPVLCTSAPLPQYTFGGTTT